MSLAFDGGALYLYDFAGDLGDLSELLESARAVAAARLAAVLCVTALDGDPLVGALLERAFERDSDDHEIDRGSVRRSVLLVRSLD
ncbi:MAG: hypothetical protein GIW95_11290 [Candidatus Eremiobacteraeota bacterium]|nr:hypothetical protein [Candidatus Eremiobacteraeota bacterium]